MRGELVAVPIFRPLFRPFSLLHDFCHGLLARQAFQTRLSDRPGDVEPDISESIVLSSEPSLTNSRILASRPRVTVRESFGSLLTEPPAIGRSTTRRLQ